MNLPNKISELLTLALNDLLKVEKLKDYKIDMSHWHGPVQDKCRVCLGGCTIVGQGISDPTRGIFPNEFPIVTENKLRALDRLRQNMINKAVRLIYKDKADNVMRATFNSLDFMLPNHPTYKRDRLKFLRNLRWLARKFKAAGY